MSYYGSQRSARPRSIAGAGILLAALLAVVAVAPPAGAQELSRLGLSAAPDSYVDTLTIGVGQPFKLYVIVTGPHMGAGLVEPVPFDLQAVQWAVFTSCCGATPVLVTGVTYAPGTESVGIPDEQVQTEAMTCLDDDVILLAELDMDWGMEGETNFPVSAGAMTAGLDCEDNIHLLGNMIVNIVGTTRTLSDVKALYRDVGESQGGEMQ